MIRFERLLGIIFITSQPSLERWSLFIGRSKVCTGLTIIHNRGLAPKVYEKTREPEFFISPYRGSQASKATHVIKECAVCIIPTGIRK